MNILLIYETKVSVIGGTGTYLREIINGLGRRGHRVYLAFPDYGKEELNPITNVTPIPVKVLEDNYRKRTSRFIKKVNELFDTIIKKEGIDIVHVIFGWYAFASVDYTKIRELGAKPFVTVHNVPPQECMESFDGDDLVHRVKDAVQNLFRCVRSFFNIQRIDRHTVIIVPCDNVRKRMRRYLSRNRIHVISHGYNEKLICSEKKIDNKTAPEYRILTVAGIAPGKNQKLLIDVVKSVRNKAQMRVYFVGPVRNQRYCKYLMSYIDCLGLKDVFQFVDSCSDEELVRLYHNCDLYVQPSKHEGFCMAALDAAAFGMAVIGSDVGELKRISELSGGISPQYNNVDDYVKAIKHIIFNPVEGQERKKYAEAIRNKYNWDNSCEKLDELYRI